VQNTTTKNIQGIAISESGEEKVVTPKGDVPENVDDVRSD
jgi:hypothetical protein